MTTTDTHHPNDSDFSAPPRFTQKSNYKLLDRCFETAPLETFLRWSLSTFGDGLVQVTSFGPTGIVILDHLATLRPGLRVITLDTNFLFDETYQLIETIQQRYDITLEVHTPTLTPQEQAVQYSPDLWHLDPDQCCHVRKVQPLNEALQGVEAWVSGLRRDQSPARAETPLIGWDSQRELVKLNPLAGWTRGQVWKYITEHKLPYNALHDQGYTSIGCTHCTHPVTRASEERLGRWQGRDKEECGIHVTSRFGGAFNRAGFVFEGDK